MCWTYLISLVLISSSLVIKAFTVSGISRPLLSLGYLGLGPAHIWPPGSALQPGDQSSQTAPQTQGDAPIGLRSDQIWQPPQPGSSHDGTTSVI